MFLKFTLQNHFGKAWTARKNNLEVAKSRHLNSHFILSDNVAMPLFSSRSFSVSAAVRAKGSEWVTLTEEEISIDPNNHRVKSPYCSALKDVHFLYQ